MDVLNHTIYFIFNDLSYLCVQAYFCKAVPRSGTCRKRKTCELHHVYNVDVLVIIITINNNCNTATANKKRQHCRFQIIVSTSGWPVNVLKAKQSGHTDHYLSLNFWQSEPNHRLNTYDEHCLFLTMSHGNIAYITTAISHQWLPTIPNACNGK